MTFFIFLILFAGVFTFLIKDGAIGKYLILACVVSFAAMAALKIGGNPLIPTLGVGLNMFLMTYDLLALLTMKKPAKPVKAEDEMAMQGPHMPSGAADEEEINDDEITADEITAPEESNLENENDNDENCNN